MKCGGFSVGCVGYRLADYSCVIVSDAVHFHKMRKLDSKPGQTFHCCNLLIQMYHVYHTVFHLHLQAQNKQILCFISQ